MQNFDVIVIGGGSSGLFFATKIENKSVLILEKQEKVGKKILVSGNGRCNLSNKNIEPKFYTGEDISNFINSNESKNVVPYFESLGLLTYSDNEGRIYPVSNYSASVLDVLKLKLKSKKNVTIKVQEEVLEIKPHEHGFVVKTNTNEYITKNLVYALGGGNNLLRQMGYKTQKITPALCALKTPIENSLFGVKIKNALVKLKQGNNEFFEQGEVLFKENAISGICIFNLSLFYDETKKATLYIDLLNSFNEKELFNQFLNRKNNLNFAKMADFFTGVLHKSLALSILEKCEILYTQNVKDLTINQIKSLVAVIKNYELKIVGKDVNNQIHSGGLKLNDFDENLESKKHKGLYVLGEALNVQGICGGYNLHWAFLSASIAAKAINENN